MFSSVSIPANTTVTGVTIPMGWTCTGLADGAAGGTTFTCQPTGTMANGAMATIGYVVSVGAGVPQGTLITNTANVGTFGSGATPDPSSGNNTQGPTQTLVTAVADVEIVKSDSTPPTVVAGSGTVANYTLTVRNYGPSDAQAVEWVDTLPAGAREVFVLHDMEGYKHDEIAALLGIDPGTSRSQLHRARMLLRRVLV